MQSSTALTRCSSHRQPTTSSRTGDAQTNREVSDTMASPSPTENAILRLPYELLLGIFCRLSDQSCVVALACTHPVFEVVLRESRRTIRKATTGNVMAEMVKSRTGYESQYLAKIFLVLVNPSIDWRVELISAIFSDSWVASSQDIFRLRSLGQTMVTTHDVVKELEFFGCFTQSTNLDRWYRRRFSPVARWADRRHTWNSSTFTFRNPPKFENIELLMVVELWCAMSKSPRVSSPPIVTFMREFTPEIALRARQFAGCYMQGKK